jgi:hypothetical protein
MKKRVLTLCSRMEFLPTATRKRDAPGFYGGYAGRG